MSADHMERLLRALKGGTGLSASDRQWAIGAIDSFFRGVDPYEAFGVPKYQVLTPKKAARYERDYYLSAALMLTPGDSVNERAKALEREMKKFEAGPWRIWKEYSEPSRRATEVQRMLFYAYTAARVGPVCVPISTRHLRRIGKGLDTLKHSSVQ